MVAEVEVEMAVPAQQKMVEVLSMVAEVEHQKMARQQELRELLSSAERAESPHVVKTVETGLPQEVVVAQVRKVPVVLKRVVLEHVARCVCGLYSESRVIHYCYG